MKFASCSTRLLAPAAGQSNVSGSQQLLVMKCFAAKTPDEEGTQPTGSGKPPAIIDY